VLTKVGIIRKNQKSIYDNWKKVPTFAEKNAFMKIANIDLGPRPVLLAPMEDVTDPAFRFFCEAIDFIDLKYVK